MNHQPPDWNYKLGYSEILEGKIYIAGEDDVDELLYGVEESRNINNKGHFFKKPSPQIDVWIDLRDIRENNRKVIIPPDIEYISIPFRDGVLAQAKEMLPKAKEVLVTKQQLGLRTLVSCHQGRSRSAMLILWYLSETLNSYNDAFLLLKSKRNIIEPDRNFKTILNEWKNIYN